MGEAEKNWAVVIGVRWENGVTADESMNASKSLTNARAHAHTHTHILSQRLSCGYLVGNVLILRGPPQEK